MNALIKDALKLVIITVVAGLVLGAVYGITKGPIADQEAKAQMEAYKTVFPKASDFKEVDGFSEEAASKIIAANENPIEGHDSDVISSAVEAVDASGEALGYIFNVTTSKGYGGDIQLTVGIQSDGTVSGYSVLSISETAGLGMKAKDDPSWGKQFAGKKVESFSVVKDGSGSGDDAKIDAISGATITSKAVTGAMNSALERLYNGIIKENPTLVLNLGMCPTLAVTTSAINGAGMGLSTTVVLMFSNMIISILRNFIPDRVRIPGYIVIIASLVTVVQFLLQGYVPALNDALGVYIPLIVVNCIILGRAESYASKNGPVSSFFDGLGMGLGFTLSLTILGAFRELLGAGTIFGKTVLAESFYTPITIFILAPGAFFVLACLVAARNKIMNRKVKNGEMEEIPAGCGDCSSCGNTCCSSKSFFDMSVDNKKEETKTASDEKAENK